MQPSDVRLDLFCPSLFSNGRGPKTVTHLQSELKYCRLHFFLLSLHAHGLLLQYRLLLLRAGLRQAALLLPICSCNNRSPCSLISTSHLRDLHASLTVCPLTSSRSSASSILRSTQLLRLHKHARPAGR